MIEAEQILDLAFEKYNQKEEATAWKLACQVQKIIPTHGDALYLLGLISLNKKAYIQARDFLNSATKLYPQKQAYQMALADCFIALKDYDQADKIYALLPKSDELTLKKGLLEQVQGHDQEAKKIFKSLLKTPLKSQALYALSFFEKGKKKETLLKDSFQIDKNFESAEALACLYLNQNRPDKLSEYQEFIQNELLGIKIFIVQKKYEFAEEKLKNSLQKNPFHVEAWDLLGQLHFQRGNKTEAESDFNKALRIDKNSYSAHKNMARLLMEQGRFFEALDHYQILCKQNLEDREILMAMLLLTEKVGDYEEALGLSFRLLSLGQKKMNQIVKRNIENLSKKNKDLAQKFLDGWKKLDPKNKTIQKIVLPLLLGSIFLFPFSSLAQVSQEESSWQIAWENKMAEVGDAISQYNVAEMFEMGKKAPKDLGKAIKYYEKSAYQGYLPAALKLGKILSQEGKYQDLNKSLEWYKYVAEKGEVQAQFYLAEYYQNPITQNDELAKFYLEKALKQTFPNESDFSKVSPQYAELIKRTKNNTLTERKIK